jgi:SAM-dependent methyltransferase
MSTTNQRQDWEDLTVLDPLWAILSEPNRRFGRWPREDFFETGRQEIDGLLRDGARFGLPVGRRDALDFGCGAGRLTQALSPHFENCLGLDLSKRMIGQARKFAQGFENCSFEVHEPPTLALFPGRSFDLVVSRLVLQHVPAADAKARYIAEFLRILRPGGLLAFQLPSHIPTRHRIQPRPRVYDLLRRMGVSPTTLYHHLRLHPIRMSSLACSRVLDVIEAAGGKVLDAQDRNVAGGVTSSDYLVTKR